MLYYSQLFAILSYSASMIVQWASVLLDKKLPKLSWLTLSALGIGGSGLYLYHIMLLEGLGSNFFTLLALIGWLISALICLATLWQPIENLALLVFPFTLISIIGHPFLSSHTETELSNHPLSHSDIALHILLASLTLSVLSVAGLESLMFRLKEIQLKNKYVGRMLHLLPSLESMEVILLQTIKIGLALLSLILISSTYLFYGQLTHPRVISKLGFTLLAYMVFAWLLIGHYEFGWRGRKMVYGVWIGVLLITLTYFSLQITARCCH